MNIDTTHFNRQNPTYLWLYKDNRKRPQDKLYIFSDIAPTKYCKTSVYSNVTFIFTLCYFFISATKCLNINSLYPVVNIYINHFSHLSFTCMGGIGMHSHVWYQYYYYCCFSFLFFKQSWFSYLATSNERAAVWLLFNYISYSTVISSTSFVTSASK